MKKVFVNGYGSIGSRVAKFIKDDPDIQIIGVGKYSPDKKVQSAIDNGFSVYVPKNKIDDFKEYGISGSIESALDDCDLVIDASPVDWGILTRKISMNRRTSWSFIKGAKLFLVTMQYLIFFLTPEQTMLMPLGKSM